LQTRKRQMCFPIGVIFSQLSCGRERVRVGFSGGSEYRATGIARVNPLRFGVPPL
jgi:hypothetical protein